MNPIRVLACIGAVIGVTIADRLHPPDAVAGYTTDDYEADSAT